MNIRRTLATTAVVALSVAGLAACGDGDGGNGSGGGSTAGSGEKVEMTFWHNSTTGAGKDFWQKTVDDFMVANPNIKISIQSIQNEDLDGKLQTALNSGDAPDIFMQRGGGKMAAMVKANFFYVFLGIESPSKESLTETKKFQNLRLDPVESIKIIQRGGLWVTGGFIVGFDSDPENIFEQQIKFIEDAAVPWAMMNFLHAVPLTPLHDRMKREGRLIEHSVNSSDSTVSNFRTVIPAPILVRGYQKTLQAIYEPDNFFDRAWRSLQDWQTKQTQHPAKQPGPAGMAKILFRSLWHQGLRSSYKRAYWKFLLKLVSHYLFDHPRLWLGFTILISAHHFIPYAQEVVEKVGLEITEPVAAPEPVPQTATA